MDNHRNTAITFGLLFAIAFFNAATLFVLLSLFEQGQFLVMLQSGSFTFGVFGPELSVLIYAVLLVFSWTFSFFVFFLARSGRYPRGQYLPAGIVMALSIIGVLSGMLCSGGEECMGPAFLALFGYIGLYAAFVSWFALWAGRKIFKQSSYRRIILVLFIGVICMLLAGLFIDLRCGITASQRQRCYETVAIALGDLSYCDLVDERKNTCYAYVAEKADNVGTCEHIDDDHQRDFCYDLLATKLKRADLCSYIKNDYSKQFCLNHVGQQE